MIVSDSEEEKRKRRRRAALAALLLLSPWKLLRMQIALAAHDVDTYFDAVDVALVTTGLKAALRGGEGIVAPMQRLVRAALVQGYEAGEGLGGRRITSGVRRQFDAMAADRAQQIRELMTGTSRKWLKGDPNSAFALSMTRAERAVRFEAGNHFYEGLQKSVWGLGMTKSWVTTSENPCEEICIPNEDEGPIPVEEQFPSGDYAPLGHLNCECVLSITPAEDM